MLIDQVTNLIQLLLSHLLDVLSPQDIFDAADTPLHPTVALAVVGAGVDVVYAHLLQEVGEGGPDAPCPIAADLVGQL